jgi:hypothetical protein
MAITPTSTDLSEQDRTPGGRGTPAPASGAGEHGESELQRLAKRHLWMHFTRMGVYEEGAEVPVIVKG